MTAPALAGQRVLVTGATGFLGGALARRLALAEDAEVTALGRNQAVGRALERELAGAGVRFIQADLAQAGVAEAACAGQAVVFHCAALAAPWGPYAEFYRGNVTTTENVIRGCQAAGARLVHVSTPSVYFGSQARLNVAESDPLPARQLTHYAATKLLAETAVDRAAADGLPAITIRPRAIFGPRDTTIMPRLIRQVERGRLRIIGKGDNQADLTYIDNVVDALLLCARAPASALGRKYNITNGQPVRLWQVVGELCTALGYPAPRQHLSLPAALALAESMEWAHALLRQKGEPLLTRQTVRMLALSSTLDIRAARRDLGYEPAVSLAEGLRRFVEWWKAGQA